MQIRLGWVVVGAGARGWLNAEDLGDCGLNTISIDISALICSPAQHSESMVSMLE